ncbi:MAG: putative two-component system response regulator [Thermoleophilia bacterium]|nr:putative two-component system response regulator [Thermoleophilia bacterium]
MTEKQKQIGRNEHAARAANELVSVEGEEARLLGPDQLAVLCECGDADCHDALTMSVDEYEEIRSHPSQFAVLRGHEMLEAENVVVDHDRYLIVQKFGDAGDVADAGDPRNHLKPCRVVIVDDMPEMRYLLNILVATEPSCTIVGEAADGVEAVEMVKATQPEVVVLDLEMPVMDGWHALPEIRRVSPTSNVIVYSGTRIDARLNKRLVNLGASRFVPKGGSPSIVMDAIREVSLGGRNRVFSEQARTS